MALSSGVWAPVFPAPALQQQGSGSTCGTVLMSVRVSLSRATLRALRPLRTQGAAEDDAALRLQLSMDPNRPGDFRLTLRDSGSNGRITVQLRALKNNTHTRVHYLQKQHHTRLLILSLSFKIN